MLARKSREDSPSSVTVAPSVLPSSPSLCLSICLSCVKELKATNETLKSLQTQLELAYATTTASSTCLIGGSVAVPPGVPGNSTLTAILETKDARIQTLERQVHLLESELQRIRDCGGRLREQLLHAVPSRSSDYPHQQHQHNVRYLSQLRPTSTSPLFAGHGHVNPGHDRQRQLHQNPNFRHHHYQNVPLPQHMRQIEPAALHGALNPHAHAFNKYDLSFRRQVSLTTSPVTATTFRYLEGHEITLDYLYHKIKDASARHDDAIFCKLIICEPIVTMMTTTVLICNQSHVVYCYSAYCFVTIGT